MKSFFSVVSLLSFIFVLVGYVSASQSNWQVYRSEEYGFEMLVAKGTKLIEHDYGHNTAGLYAKSGDVEFFALGDKDKALSLDELEDLGEEISEIPGKYWKLIDADKNVHGFKEYRTYEANLGDVVVYGIVGSGPKASFLLLLKTTKNEIKKYPQDYLTWYASVKAF